MEMIDESMVTGGSVVLKRTDPRHFTVDGKGGPLDADEKKNFKDMLFDALEGTNDLQHQSTEMAKKMIIDPDSVHPHDITIALMKARTSFALTKAVTDSAVRAYKEMINIR